MNRVDVEFFETDDYVFTARERKLVTHIARSTVEEVRSLLPGLPKSLAIRIQNGDATEVRESGDNASVLSSDTIHWTVFAKHELGVLGVAETQLRATLFHELHHLVRDRVVPCRSVLDRAVAEGLAVAFERDYGHISKPWGWYTAPEAASWVDELHQLPASVEPGPWLDRLPDGRRWVAFKAGAYLVDRAVRATGKTPAELVTASTSEIVSLAGDG